MSLVADVWAAAYRTTSDRNVCEHMYDLCDLTWRAMLPAEG
jgi:hypothetical protein